MAKVHTRWYIALMILTVGLSSGDAAAPPQAGKPKEDRAKKLAKMFDALDTPNLEARGKACIAIVNFLGKGDLDAVAKAAMDERLLVRLYAIQFLARYKTHSPAEPPDIAAVLLACLRDENARVRAIAAFASSVFAADSPALLEALIKALDDHALTGDGPGYTVSQWAASSLGRMGPKARPAYKALIRAADKSPDATTRRYALEAIGLLGAKDRSHLPLLLGALLDRLKKAKSADERAAAANAMRHLGADAAVAVPALRAAFRGPDEKDAFAGCGKVQYGVLEAYCGIGRGAKSALPDLLPDLRDKKLDAVYRITIIRVVIAIGEDAKDAWPIIRRIATESGDLQLAAEAALKTLNQKK